MASITVRNLDDLTKERLRVRAASHRRSMEEEARDILRAAVAKPDATPSNLALAVRRRFHGFHVEALPIPPREPIREPPKPARK